MNQDGTRHRRPGPPIVNVEPVASCSSLEPRESPGGSLFRYCPACLNVFVAGVVQTRLPEFGTLLAHIWHRRAQSDALEYLINLFGFIVLEWSHPPGSNRRPADYESAALPTELGWPGELFSRITRAAVKTFRQRADIRIWNMNSPESSVLDRDIALSRVGGDAELLREIAVLFLDNYTHWLDELREAATRGDAPAVEKTAHGIKGSVANFGAQSAVDAAFAL